MPKSIHVDHHDTAFYIPKYHRTEGLNKQEKEIYKILERRFFHEGRVIDPSYLEDQPNLRQTFAAIKFDYLLDINEQIFSVFVLEFYKSVRLIQNLNGSLSPLSLEMLKSLFDWRSLLVFFVFHAKVFVFTPDWAISSLPNGKTRKVKGVPTTLDPFQMVISELKVNLRKWETILSENVISLTGNKDHTNACLCYMLYCLTIVKPFNLAYYIAKRMESMTKSDIMALSYGMLLTHLFEHVRISHPFAIIENHYLVDHVMLPLSESQIIPTQGIDVSPLALRALVFSTPPSSPIEPHPYLTTLDDLPARISNPPPPSLSQSLSQTLPLPTPMDFEPSFPPINLS
ncbi:hypothetical protein Tco_0051379 [Tanacetum coccineum]